MSMPLINPAYLQSTLRRLLETPSPSGMTDAVVRLVCEMLDELGIAYQLTRRGAIRALLPGRQHCPKRAVASHPRHPRRHGQGPQTQWPTGALAHRLLVLALCRGRARTIYADFGNLRGTVCPSKASGHTFNKEIDTQPVDWTQVEVRLDERVASVADLMTLGVRVGDTVSFDTRTEFGPTASSPRATWTTRPAWPACWPRPKRRCATANPCRWTCCCCSPSRKRWGWAPRTCCTAATSPSWRRWTTAPWPRARTPRSTA